MRAFYVSSFLDQPPFPHLVSISNYIRGKVSRLASRGRGTSLMWIWIWTRISPPISFPRLSRVVRLRGEDVLPTFSWCSFKVTEPSLICPAL